MAKVDQKRLPPEVVEYFAGDRDQAQKWFTTPVLTLGCKSPSTLSFAKLHELLHKLRNGMTD